MMCLYSWTWRCRRSGEGISIGEETPSRESTVFILFVTMRQHGDKNPSVGVSTLMNCTTNRDVLYTFPVAPTSKLVSIGVRLEDSVSRLVSRVIAGTNTTSIYFTHLQEEKIYCTIMQRQTREEMAASYKSIDEGILITQSHTQIEAAEWSAHLHKHRTPKQRAASWM